MRLGPFCVHKLSLKLFLACTFTSVTTLYLFWSGCEVHSTLPTNKYEEIRGVPLTAIDCSKVIAGTSKDEDNPTERTELSTQRLAESDAAVCPNDHRIDVIVNGGKKLEGRLIENEAYVPFSFVKDYFDIYGDLQELDGKTVLDWRHSYSDIHHPKAGVVYETKDPFLWFEHYHVEGRSRVKCISGVEDVPVSLQWSPEGHFYPIQIAQYGLSHYNLLHIEGDSEGKEKVFEDAETVSEVNWSWAFPKSAQITNVFDKERNSRVLQFSTTGKIILICYIWLFLCVLLLWKHAFFSFSSLSVTACNLTRFCTLLCTHMLISSTWAIVLFLSFFRNSIILAQSKMFVLIKWA